MYLKCIPILFKWNKINKVYQDKNKITINLHVNIKQENARYCARKHIPSIQSSQNGKQIIINRFKLKLLNSLPSVISTFWLLSFTALPQTGLVNK